MCTFYIFICRWPRSIACKNPKKIARTILNYETIILLKNKNQGIYFRMFHWFDLFHAYRWHVSSFSLLQVALGSPGMWSYKSCQYYVCYLVMILVLVSSTHSHPSSPRTKGHNIDKHVLQRYLQMRTLANHKVQTFKNINDFRQTLDKLEHIYSHKGR